MSCTVQSTNLVTWWLYHKWRLTRTALSEFYLLELYKKGSSTAGMGSPLQFFEPSHPVKEQRFKCYLKFSQQSARYYET